MFRILRGMPPGTIAVAVVGKVTENDYRDVLGPALDQAQEQHGQTVHERLGRDRYRGDR
jgi:hypothetical protein